MKTTRLSQGAQASLFAPCPYKSQLDAIDGLRQALNVRRDFNLACYDRTDPPCPPCPPKEEEPEAARLRRLAEAARREHETRTRETRKAGIRLPLDELAEKHRLDRSERHLVETLLVIKTTLTRDMGYGGTTCDVLARAAAYWDCDTAQGFLPRLLPDSRLCRSGLVNIRTGNSDVTRWTIDLGPDILPDLLARNRSVPAAPAESTVAAEPPADIVGWLAREAIELTPAAAEEVAALWSWVANGDLIFREWGFGAADHSPAGIRLLFHGPSGTGKTLTAKALARALGRDCRLVSCTDILNKYVGGTEKNLRQCFIEAGESNSVLVFDEADALFGRRGEIARAGERLYNSEVNAALVELENFAGVCILTTNHLDLLDQAVLRRTRSKVHFGPPEAETRARIWRAHLPPAAPLDDDVDLGRLAEAYPLTGGQIANAALAAAGRAAGRVNEAPGRVITMADLEAGAAQEAAADGRLVGLSGPLGF